MAEVAYRCEKCRRDYPLAGARECEFVCQQCDEALQRIVKPPSTDLGAPQFKGDTVRLSKLFKAPQGSGAGGDLADQLIGGEPKPKPKPVARAAAPDLADQLIGEPKPKPAPRPAERRPAPRPRNRVQASPPRAESTDPPRNLAEVLPPDPERKRAARSWRPVGVAALILVPALGLFAWLGTRSSRGDLAQARSELEAKVRALQGQHEQSARELQALRQRADRLARAGRGTKAVEALRHNYRFMIPDVVDRFSTAVVHIIDKRTVWIHGKRHPRQRTGSGFIISSGYAVTNYHVVSGAHSVRCRLFNGEEIEATVHGSDPASDISLLRLDLEGVPGAKKIVPAVWGDSSRLRPGELVIALGSPRSLDRSISLGIVSNVARYQAGLPLSQPWIVTGQFNTWIQTDSAINPGNSGGPLINLDGEVIGVVTRKILNADNIGFASPSSHVRPVVELLLKHKTVPRSTIGVFIEAYNPMDPDAAGGVKVVDVLPGSPAERAGIRGGDILLRYAGKKLRARFNRELPAARQQLAAALVGRPIKLVIDRVAREMEMKVVPRSRRLTDDRIHYLPGLGFYATEVTADLLARHNLCSKTGIWVCGLKSSAMLARHGVQKGDVLIAIDGVPTRTMAEFWKRYRHLVAKKKSPLPITMMRTGQKPRVISLRIAYPR